MREKSSEKRSDCTRRGGASSTRNVDRKSCSELKAALGRLLCFWGANMIKAGIVGGTGYTGVELLRLLSQHREVELRAITSRKEAGSAVTSMFPGLRGHVDLNFTEPSAQALRGCDVVFFATPN